MSGERSVNVANWLSAVATAFSALAAFFSYHVASIQTDATLSEKNVRPHVVWSFDKNIGSTSLSVKGNIQFARDVDIEIANVVGFRYSIKKSGETVAQGIEKYFVFDVGQDLCYGNDASDTGNIQECELDMNTFKRIQRDFSAFSEYYSQCSTADKPIQTTVYKIMRVKYVDILGHSQSDYLRLTPSLHLASVMNDFSAIQGGGMPEFQDYPSEDDEQVPDDRIGSIKFRKEIQQDILTQIIKFLKATPLIDCNNLGHPVSHIGRSTFIRYIDK